MVAVGGAVARGDARLGEVVHEAVVGVESALAIAGSGRLRIAVVHPQLLRRTGRQGRHVDPDQGDAQQRVELLDLVVQHRFIVARHEAQVGAVVADAFEVEVTRMQAQQHGNAAGIAAHGARLRAGVDGDGFAVSPVGLPPGMRQAGNERAQDREQEKKTLHDSDSPKKSPKKCGAGELARQ
ncbi:hypothetical protein D3C72_1328430 [compost metagenome]